MTNITSTDTLTGSFEFAKIVLKDGTEIETMVKRTKNPDGTLGAVILDDRAQEFENRFNDTETVPNNFDTPTTGPITKKDTARHEIEANLVKWLGDPDEIIKHKGLTAGNLEHLKQHPSSASLLRGMCVIRGGVWTQVMQFIPKYAAIPGADY